MTMEFSRNVDSVATAGTSGFVRINSENINKIDAQDGPGQALCGVTRPTQLPALLQQKRRVASEVIRASQRRRCAAKSGAEQSRAASITYFSFDGSLLADDES